jgi:hypothetical protein
MAYIPVDIEESVKRECRRRKYSERTIKTYLYCINRFLKSTGKPSLSLSGFLKTYTAMNCLGKVRKMV